MRIVLCDDDPAVMDQLRQYLQEFFEQNQIPQPDYAVYTDGETLLSQEAGGGDIVFLDVEMAGMDGIHVGATLKKRHPDVKIFIVTAYMDYLDEAMKFQVFRYLSKPIDKERLFRNMQDALSQHFEDERLVLLKTRDGTTVLRENEIVFVETTDRGTMIHTSDTVYRSPKRIENWQAELRSNAFYAPHRSFIINMKYVSFFNNTVITLEDKTGARHSVCLARRRFPDFREAYLLYSTARM